MGLSGGGGYASFPDDTGNTFEDCVKDIKKHDGDRYRVVRYNEYDNWPLNDLFSITFRIKRKIRELARELLFP